VISYSTTISSETSAENSEYFFFKRLQIILHCLSIGFNDDKAKKYKQTGINHLI